MSLDEIVAIYTKLALRELNVPDADARVNRPLGEVDSARSVAHNAFGRTLVRIAGVASVGNFRQLNFVPERQRCELLETGFA